MQHSTYVSTAAAVLVLVTFHTLAPILPTSASFLSSSSASGGFIDDHFNEPDSIQLGLCDCHTAQGFPNGLSCEKEGFFVVGFEHTGIYRVTDSGFQPQVPLAPAICCRPCLPQDMQTVPGLPAGAAPVGVVSLGCRSFQPSDSPLEGLTCMDSYSAVAGFPVKQALPSGAQIVYGPSDLVECCTPGLLLSTGDVWELQRCNCTRQYPSVQCGPKDNRFLQGFISTRMVQLMDGDHRIPLSPTTCCGVCLGSRIHRLDDCSHLDNCNSNGACVMAQCQCYPGWEGPTCGISKGGGRGGDGDGEKKNSLLSTWSMVVAATSLSMVGVLLLRVACPLCRQRPVPDEESEDGDNMRVPLLEVDGSVGSQDTEDESEDCEAEQHEDEAQPLWEGDENVNMTEEELSSFPVNSNGSFLVWLRALLQLGARLGPDGAADTTRSQGAPDSPRAVDLPSLAPSTPVGIPPSSAASQLGSTTAYEPPPTLQEDDVNTPTASSDHPLGSPRGTHVTTARSDITHTSVNSHSSSTVAGRHAAGSAAQRLERVVSNEGEVQAGVESEDGESEAAEATYADSDGPYQEAGTSVPDNSATPFFHSDDEHGQSHASHMDEGDHVIHVDGSVGEQELGRAFQGLACSVCMTRPIQVGLVPCGHSNLCRRCSRRLDKCPFCRKDIIRRQRLYIGS